MMIHLAVALFYMQQSRDKTNEMREKGRKGRKEGEKEGERVRSVRK